MIDWTLDLFFPRDITQLQGFRLDGLHVSHYGPGEETVGRGETGGVPDMIVRRGEIGRELYMIVRGEVEVIESRGEGKTEALKARLGPKEVFGEKALLENVPRTATVRAVGAVDVVVLSRGDFVRLVDQLPAL